MSLPETLPTFSLAEDQMPLFYAWLYSNFEAYIKPRILVAGKTLNALADFMITWNNPFHLGTLDTDDLLQLRSKYLGNTAIRSIKHINLKDEAFVQHYPTKIGIFSTIIYAELPENKTVLNSYLANIYILLRPGGHALITMPSFNTPFSSASISYDDLESLDRRTLKPLLTNFSISKLRHFHLTSSNCSSLEYKEINYIATIVRKAS